MKRLVVLISLFCLFLFFRPKAAFGLVNCCGPGLEDVRCRRSDICAKDITRLLSCCYSACPYTDWTDTPLSECQTNLGYSPSNTCCTSSGGCSSNCGNISQWTYCYGVCQKRANPTKEGECLYQYRYTYTSCGATDTCVSGEPYLYAGLCDSNGCKVGGKYKTCCNSNGTVDGNCTGGQFTGSCPSGSIAVQCGFGDKPACGAAACQSIAPTPTPTPTPAVTYSCDPYCGEGVCGKKGSDGSCTIDYTCCHRVCQAAGSCMTVSDDTLGTQETNVCDKNADCVCTPNAWDETNCRRCNSDGTGWTANCSDYGTSSDPGWTKEKWCNCKFKCEVTFQQYWSACGETKAWCAPGTTCDTGWVSGPTQNTGCSSCQRISATGKYLACDALGDSTLEKRFSGTYASSCAFRYSRRWHL